jgi:hypothetical protein
MDAITVALKFDDGQVIKREITFKELGLHMDADDEYFYKRYGFHKTDRCALENYIHNKIDENPIYEVSWRIYHGPS